MRMNSRPEPAWYRSPVPAATLRALCVRSTGRGLLQSLLHGSLLCATGAIALLLALQQQWMTFAVVLPVHGALFCFLGYAGLGHELAHRTVFAHRGMNDALFALVSFFTWNNPVFFRKSHVLHHRFTLHPAHDGEVKAVQTSILRRWPHLVFLDLPFLWRAVRIASQNATGKVEGTFAQQLFPSGSADRRRLVRWARVLLAGQLSLAALFIGTGLWPLVLLVNLAPFFGTFPSRLLSQAQHFGMKADSADLRENCRTVILNPYLATLYWQMNYHVEHHMYPGVPFFNLPKLHGIVRSDLHPPVVGMIPLMAVMSGKT